MTFIKLKDVTGFTVTSVGPAFFKAWDDVNKKMLKSDTYIKSDDLKYSKAFDVLTDQGTLSVSESQMGQMLLAWVDNGKVDLAGKAFTVKNNGQPGADIRYYINRDYSGPTPSAGPVSVPGDPSTFPRGMEPADASDLPF